MSDLLGIGASALKSYQTALAAVGENVANAHKVKRVVANGRVYELDQLIRGTGATRTTSASR